jgi:hypothetical protein
LDQKNELAIFLDGLKISTRITFVLFDGTVVSVNFATPKRHPDFIGSDPFEHRVLLRSVTVRSGKRSINIPMVDVEYEKIASWEMGEPQAPEQ